MSLGVNCEDKRAYVNGSVFSVLVLRKENPNTYWDGWIRTSGITESKSVALPLGYIPVRCGQ